MYHDYVTISLVNKLKKTFNVFLLYVCSLLTLGVKYLFFCSVTVQMIGSLNTDEENYMEWPGGDKMNILRIVWRVFFCF